MNEEEKHAQRLIDNAHQFRLPKDEDRDMENVMSALAMIVKYGLWHLSVDEIITKWEEHSENASAGWLIDCSKQIEEVFDVKLVRFYEPD